MEIHVNRKGKDLGPFTLEQIRGYLESEDLSAQDFGWYEGASDWITLQALVATLDPPTPPNLPPPTAEVPAPDAPNSLTTPLLILGGGAIVVLILFMLAYNTFISHDGMKGLLQVLRR